MTTARKMTARENGMLLRIQSLELRIQELEKDLGVCAKWLACSASTEGKRNVGEKYMEVKTLDLNVLSYGQIRMLVSTLNRETVIRIAQCVHGRIYASLRERG